MQFYSEYFVVYKIQQVYPVPHLLLSLDPLHCIARNVPLCLEHPYIRLVKNLNSWFLPVLVEILYYLKGYRRRLVIDPL